jgi:hypothetical protein
MRRIPFHTKARTPGMPGTAGRGHVWVGDGGTRKLVPTHPARFAHEGCMERGGRDQSGRAKRRGHPRQETHQTSRQRHPNKAYMEPLPMSQRDRGTDRKVPSSSIASKQASRQAERQESLQVRGNANRQVERHACRQRCMRNSSINHKNAREQRRGTPTRDEVRRTPVRVNGRGTGGVVLGAREKQRAPHAEADGFARPLLPGDGKGQGNRRADPGKDIRAHGKPRNGRRWLARVCYRIRIWFRRVALRRARRDPIAMSLAS